MVMRSRMVPTWQCCDIMVNNPLATQPTMSALARIERSSRTAEALTPLSESSVPAALAADTR